MSIIQAHQELLCRKVTPRYFWLHFSIQLLRHVSWKLCFRIIFTHYSYNRINVWKKIVILCSILTGVTRALKHGFNKILTVESYTYYEITVVNSSRYCNARMMPTGVYAVRLGLSEYAYACCNHYESRQAHCRCRHCCRCIIEDDKTNKC